MKFSWAESGWSLISRPTSVQPFNDNERGCMIEGCLHTEQINTKCKCGKVAEDELKQMERTFIFQLSSYSLCIYVCVYVCVPYFLKGFPRRIWIILTDHTLARAHTRWPILTFLKLTVMLMLVCADINASANQPNTHKLYNPLTHSHKHLWNFLITLSVKPTGVHVVHVYWCMCLYRGR